MKLFKRKSAKQRTKERIDAIHEVHILKELVNQNLVLAPVANQAIKCLEQGANPLTVRDRLSAYVYDIHEIATQHQRYGHVHYKIPKNPFG